MPRWASSWLPGNFHSQKTLLKRFFGAQSHTVGSVAAILLLSGIGSRLLGLWRDWILAGLYGAGRELDIYYAAFRLPDLLFTLLVVGALSSAFLPIFTSYRLRNHADAERLASNTANVLALVLGIGSLLGMLLAPVLLGTVAPGFSASEMRLAVTLTRIMFLSPLLLGLSSVAGSLLQSYRLYGALATAPLLYNLGIIGGALALTKPLGPAGLAWGVVAGALLHLAIHLPSLSSLGLSWRPIFDLRERGLRQIALLTLPRLIGLGAAQANLLVLTALASFFAAGSIAIFNLASNLQAVPVGVIAIAFATAAFPILAEQWAGGDQAGFSRTFQKTFREMFFLIAPLSAFLWLLRTPLVRAVLSSGAFGGEGAALTASSVGLFAVSVPAQGLILLLVRAFYARHNTRTPVSCGALTVLLNIGLALALTLSPDFGGKVQELLRGIFRLSAAADVRVLGLVASYTLAQVTQCLLLLDRLRRELPGGYPSAFWHSIGRSAILALAASLFVPAALRLSQRFLDDTPAGSLLQGIAGSAAGAGAWLALAYITRAEELAGIKDLWRGRTRQTPSSSAEALP